MSDQAQNGFSGDIMKTRTPDDYARYENLAGDLLCDLMHYCHENKISWVEQMKYAEKKFVFEE